MVVVFVGVRNVCFFLIKFISVRFFKLVFLRKAVIGCKLLNISLKLMSMLNKCQYMCLLFPLYLATLGFMLTKMVLCLYIWVYSFLKVMNYQSGQLSQLVFVQLIHLSPY